MNEYENLRRVAYTLSEHGSCQFVPVCPTCGRFVWADASMSFQYSWLYESAEPLEPNATCARCGRVAMPCEGWF